MLGLLSAKKYSFSSDNNISLPKMRNDLIYKIVFIRDIAMIKIPMNKKEEKY